MTIRTTNYILPSGESIGAVRRLHVQFQTNEVGEPGANLAYNDVMNLFARVELSAYRFSEQEAAIYLYNAGMQLAHEHKDFSYVSTMRTFSDRLYYTKTRYKHDMHEVYDALLRAFYGGELMDDWNDVVTDLRQRLEIVKEDDLGPYGARFNRRSHIAPFRKHILDSLLIDRRSLSESEEWRMSAYLYALHCLIPQVF